MREIVPFVSAITESHAEKQGYLGVLPSLR